MAAQPLPAPVVFGEAGAIDFFGPRYGLPKAICPHQNYFLWGPRNYTGEIMILIGSRVEDAQSRFDSVQVAAILDNPYALSFETRPILLCRGLHGNLQTLWPRLKVGLIAAEFEAVLTRASTPSQVLIGPYAPAFARQSSQS